MTEPSSCANLINKNVKSDDEESTHFQYFTENIPDIVIGWFEETYLS